MPELTTNDASEAPAAVFPTKAVEARVAQDEGRAQEAEDAEHEAAKEAAELAAIPSWSPAGTYVSDRHSGGWKQGVAQTGGEERGPKGAL